jgi:catechol 2,3-dioxygenase-like lactoylglutathione lyase family enzyme
MTDPRILVLYVRHAGESAAFYAGLLGKPPAESSPNFVLFQLDSGVQLGLWTAGMVQPPATAAGGSELCFMVEDRAAVDARHAAWADQGLRIAQPPTVMDFGYTFVALDPDGHRLRVIGQPAR